MLKLIKSHLLPLTIIAILILFLTRNIWGTRAWIETHDGIFHVIRLESFVAALRSGQFPVRWAGNLDNGYGLPIFNYVYPLPYYLVAPLNYFGISSKWCIKILGIFVYTLGAYGFYALGARTQKKVGILAAAIFLTTPYILVNLFVRGALGELMALAIFPWTLYFAPIKNTHSVMSNYLQILTLSCMLMSHNFLGFILLPIWFFFCLFQGAIFSKLLRSLLGSLALAAFFLFPMVFERDLVYSGVSKNYTYNFADHFIYPHQIVYSPWGIGHSVVSDQDGFSLEVGIPHLILLLSALVIMLRSQLRYRYLYLATFICIFILMMPFSIYIWKIILPLQILQFPWRLLGIIGVLIPTLYTILTFSKKELLLVWASIFVAFVFAYQYTIPFYYQSNEQFAVQLYIHRDKTTTSSRLELLPKWASTSERYLPADHVRIESGNATITIIEQKPSKIVFKSSTSAPNTKYHLSRNYFPSWVIKTDTNTFIYPSPTEDGEMIFQGIEGEHVYTLMYRSTTLQLIGNITTLITFCWLTLNSLLQIKSRHD